MLSNAGAYTIRYYRNQDTAAAYRRAGIDKPAGWVTSTHPMPLTAAAKTADHINSLPGDATPVEVVRLSLIEARSRQ